MFQHTTGHVHLNVDQWKRSKHMGISWGGGGGGSSKGESIC